VHLSLPTARSGSPTDSLGQVEQALRFIAQLPSVRANRSAGATSRCGPIHHNAGISGHCPLLAIVRTHRVRRTARLNTGCRGHPHDNDSCGCTGNGPTDRIGWDRPLRVPSVRDAAPLETRLGSVEAPSAVQALHRWRVALSAEAGGPPGPGNAARANTRLLEARRRSARRTTSAPATRRHHARIQTLLLA
jgi:hypothetical protein